LNCVGRFEEITTGKKACDSSLHAQAGVQNIRSLAIAEIVIVEDAPFGDLIDQTF